MKTFKQFRSQIDLSEQQAKLPVVGEVRYMDFTTEEPEQTPEKLNTYRCFYRGKTVDVKAKTSYEAQQLGAKSFKAKKSYEVTPVLLQLADGKPYVNPTDF